MFWRDSLRKDGRRRYYKIDFVIPEHNIAIECDGEYWHQDKEADRIRQTEIEKKGFTFIRFSGNEIRNNLSFCSDEIDRVLNNHDDNYDFIEIEINNIKKYKQKQITPITKYNLEVETDNSYIVNGVVVHNCDSMTGVYPKNFTFLGWHSNCYCYTTTIMLNDAKFKKYLDNGTIPSKNYVKKMPKKATNYIKDNKKAIDNLKNTPYWLRQNENVIKDNLK